MVFEKRRFTSLMETASRAIFMASTGSMNLDEDPTLEPFERTPSANDDLPPQDIEAAKRKSRLNALVLGLVFLLVTIAPYPWNLLSPVLLLAPLLYSLIDRMRRAPASPGPASGPSALPQRTDAPNLQPYSSVPKDPKDPRRYKPIG